MSMLVPVRWVEKHQQECEQQPGQQEVRGVNNRQEEGEATIEADEYSAVGN